MVTDKFSIREQNESLVLSTIIQHPAVSRAAISQLTGLNKASTSEIVKKLIEEEFVVETGAGTSSSVGGRRPILLELNGEAGCSLSIDVGYDYFTTLLTNLKGEIIAETKESGVLITKENIIEKIQAIMQKYAPHYRKHRYELIGMTLAIHGIIHENQIVFTPYSNLDELDLATLLKDKWQIPIFLENEANLNVLGEKTFHHPYKNMISVSIHSGVGAGILINGELYNGTRGQGGEIGHMVIQPHGHACPCGNRGCMEQYCSEIAILKEYETVVPKEQATLPHLRQRYLEKSDAEVQLIEKAADFLAIGLNNLIAHFDPEVLLLNSSLFQELPFLIALIEQRMVSKFAKEVPLIVSTLREQAPLWGGTVVNLQHFLRIPELDYQHITKENPTL